MAVTSRLIAVAVAISAVLAVAPASSWAGAQGHGNARWTYSVEFEILGVAVSGSVTLSEVGEGTISVEGVDVPVDIYRFEGIFGGQATVLGLSHIVTGVCEGYRYEAPGTPSVVREESRTLANLSVGLGDLHLADQVDICESVTYAPPLMSLFDPEKVSAGDSWVEVVNRTDSATYDDGLQSTETNGSAEVEYAFSVESTGSLLSTDAGEFDTVEFLVESGDSREARWYSSEAGGFARVEMFSGDEDEPYFVAELTDRVGAPDDDALVVLAVLSVVLAALVLAAVSVLAVVRRGHHGDGV